MLTTPPIWPLHLQIQPIRPLSPLVCHSESLAPSRRLYNPHSLVHRPRPSPIIVLLPADMEQTTTSQSFVPLFDTLPSSRTSAASIWAPQPQPSDTAWTKAIDTFSRSNFVDGLGIRPAPHRSSSYPAPHNGEDIFGPVGVDGHRRRDVGAIGDGRKKLSPTFDDNHVRRLYAHYMHVY